MILRLTMLAIAPTCQWRRSARRRLIQLVITASMGRLCNAAGWPPGPDAFIDAVKQIIVRVQRFRQTASTGTRAVMRYASGRAGVAYDRVGPKGIVARV